MLSFFWKDLRSQMEILTVEFNFFFVHAADMLMYFIYKLNEIKNEFMSVLGKTNYQRFSRFNHTMILSS